MGQVDAFIAVEDYLTLANRTRIVDFATMSRLPAIYGLREFVDAGGLMSYGTDRRDLFRRSAAYIHRIFDGAKSADSLGENTARDRFRPHLAKSVTTPGAPRDYIETCLRTPSP